MPPEQQQEFLWERSLGMAGMGHKQQPGVGTAQSRLQA